MFEGISLEADQAAILDQIRAAVREHKTDVLVIAGDIFDRAVPPASAVRMFNSFLSRIVQETDAAIVMIAGNHDSADRIESMAILPDRARVLVRGAVRADEEPLILLDEAGPVAFSALPFAYEHAAQECFGDTNITTPHDVLAAQAVAARETVPEGARWVVLAHAFVAGGEVGDTERPLTRVGGIETVPSEVFSGAHYVALGHLHRPQQVGAPHIRYSGAPLAYGFDEAGGQKSMTLVDLDGAGKVSIETLPFRPIRDVRILRGKFTELLQNPPSEDFIKVVLTDEALVIDGMKRLREVFPNACKLTYERRDRATETKALAARPSAVADPVEVVNNFLSEVRGEGVSPPEVEILADALRRIAKEEARQ
ncbi:exonuclease SbcCD subunit D [Ruegeria intermedia]|nr:exonuclease SbcCD subunit D [Ruegeria intermedia]